MQWVASEISGTGREGTAPGSMPNQITGLGRSRAREAVREQSAFRQRVASGAPWMAARMFSSVWVTSP